MHQQIRKYWFDGNPTITSFFNGLSVSIPTIERYIVGSARAALPHLKNQALRESVEILTHEEEAHARVHVAYNTLLRKQGYKIDKHVAFEEAVARFFNKRSVKTRLAVCVCSEFFTAVMGRHVLRTCVPSVKGIDERMRALWTWHSLEELHHRSTAFNLYVDQKGGYFRRTGIMLFLAVRWLLAHVSASLAILGQSKAPLSFKEIWRGVMFVLGPKGFYTNVIPSWVLFFKPGFHPAKDIGLEPGLERDLTHFHVEEHFVEFIEKAL